MGDVTLWSHDAGKIKLEVVGRGDKHIFREKLPWPVGWQEIELTEEVLAGIEGFLKIIRERQAQV